MGKRCPACAYEAPAGPQGYERGCPKCGRTYPPATAEAPPAPGAKPPVGGLTIAAIVVALGVAAVAVNHYSLRRDERAAAARTNRSPAEVYGDSAPTIRAACHRAIGESLHDRGSVEWDKEHAIDRDGAWEIRYQFRAQNAFGAMRLTAMKCTVSKVTLGVLSVTASE